MSNNQEIVLNITLANNGNGASNVIELYGTQVREDIDQMAWNLCGCDDNLQSEKFGDLALEDWSVAHKRGDDIQVKGKFTVNAMDKDFIQQVIEEYMSGFEDYTVDTANGYYSRMGRRVKFDPQPLDWAVEIK